MGFLRRVFGGKKPDNCSAPSSGSDHKPGKDKRIWSFGKSTKRKSHGSRQSGRKDFDSFTPFPDSLDANKNAIAVAAATAAVAEAALAAAHAAAEVVRLTSGGSGTGTGTGAGAAGAITRPVNATHINSNRRRWQVSAVKIQSAFRAYLARRALRALKALVKLQALVRGYIVRKQTSDMLRRMQTLVRLQAHARASRVHLSDSLHSSKSSLFYHPVHEDHEHPLHAFSTKFEGSSILKRCSSNASFRDIDPERAGFGTHWLDRWMEESVWIHPRDASLKIGQTEDEKSDKILEVDTWKPHLSSHRSSNSFHASQYYVTSDYNNEMAYESPSKRSAKALNQSLSSREGLSLSSLMCHKGKELLSSRTAENSPQTLSASSRPGSGGRRGPFTPARSECSWGFFGGYPGHPSYMANTESSRAKVRSQSAPRQRLEFERYCSSGRCVQGGLWDSDRDGDSGAEHIQFQAD